MPQLNLFNVTYESWSHEDVESGDTDSRGFIAERVSLREAINLMHDIPNDCLAIEPSDSNIGDARWVTYYGDYHYRTGVAESRSLHFPDSLTPSTRCRIFRLLQS